MGETKPTLTRLILRREMIELGSMLVELENFSSTRAYRNELVILNYCVKVFLVSEREMGMNIRRAILIVHRNAYMNI